MYMKEKCLRGVPEKKSQDECGNYKSITVHKDRQIDHWKRKESPVTVSGTYKDFLCHRTGTGN